MNKATSTKVIEFLKTQPDKLFKDRADYSAWTELEKYVEKRTEAVMVPVYKRQIASLEKAKQREKELEKEILAWSRVPGNLMPGNMVKLKGTRDRGYRKIHYIRDDHIVGWQFYYSRWPAQEGKIIMQDTITTNHVTNLRKVLDVARNKWIPIKELMKKS